MSGRRDASLLSSLLLPALLLVALLLPPAGAAGNVGCLFSEQVCLEGELCVNDLVIGSCVSSGDEDEIRMGPLEGPPLHLLQAEIERVFSQGYSWEDSYSQCVFQTVLDHIQNRQLYSPDECAHLEEDVEDTEDQEDDDIQDTRQYTNVLTGETDSDLKTDLFDRQLLAEDKILIVPADLDTERREDSSPFSRERTEDDILLSRLPEVLPNPDRLEETDDQLPQIIPVLIPTHDNDNDPVPDLVDVDTENLEQLQLLADSLTRDLADTEPRRLRAKRPALDDLDSLVLLKEMENEQDTAENNPDFDFEYQSDDKGGDWKDAVYYADREDTEPPAAAASFPMQTIFDRKERLDVKKPGPFFANSQNNFFLDKLLNFNDEPTDGDKYKDNERGQTEYEMPLTMQNKQKKAFVEFQKVGSRLPPLVEYLESPAEHSFLVVNIKDRFKTLGQAMSMVESLADHLQVPLHAFGEPRLSTSQVSLPVQSNPRQLNASTMANILGSELGVVNKRMSDDVGVEIDSFSSGNQNDVVSVYTGHSRLFFALFLLTAALASMLVVGGLVLILRRRRAKGKQLHSVEDKLGAKEEPVQEYKQLVRDWSRSSRASQGSGSGQPAAAAGPEDGGAKAGQPRTGQPPLNGVSAKPLQGADGSRTSSTSSTTWQEEPSVNQMDISTGHMVLSYMEDHLTNKQRLEQEWVGLCAYEAEPAATSIAFKVENKKKNRYPDKLPYDHNRVLLNALINGSNSDYINASTVTDHDPRNPAYIVTQGPMAHTIADFWQMVWEQGSVVIVMLSRLAENGYKLVGKYWPDEGSQQYHIYEVHLVSEHVWCEDYLVRSLYLKNTQTGETRTVTQFHFLSWPDAATPDTSKSLLEFRRKVNKSYRGRACPIIVHCSDGAGRSGTYILIDMVLNRMTKGSKEIDIAATLEHIRDQRSGMVGTRSQFEFCLTAVAEETHAILKSLASQ